MKHIFKAGKQGAPTLLLLHGTGGTEQDLLPIANIVDPDAAVLSVRGNVTENGMPRFFRRIAEGVFDEDDLIFRTKELYDFLDTASRNYHFDRGNVIAAGYSNGANIAGSLLFHYDDALRGAMLFHPMVPRRNVDLPDLTGVPIFIGSGKNDPICPPQETDDLTDMLTEAGASVHVHWEHHGHQLTRSEVEAGVRWYKDHFLAEH